MKKNIRVRHRKYNSKKKYIFPLIALSILFGISMFGVFADTGDFFVDPDTNLKYEILTEETAAVEDNGDTGNTEDNTSEEPGDDPNETPDDEPEDNPSADTNSTKVTGGTVALIGYEGTGDITTLTIPATVTDPGDDDSDADDVTYKVTAISDDASFKGNTSLTSVNGSNAEYLTYIGKAAFRGCSNLETVSFSKNLTTIDDEAFYGCTKLNKISDTATGINAIGADAFYNCISLTGFPNLSKTKVTIGEDAFWGCCYLSADNFPKDSKVFNTGIYLDAELRGTAIKSIVPADISVDTELEAPLHLFSGQKYRVTFTPASDAHKITGLKISSGTTIAEPYSIDEDIFSLVGGNANAYDFTIPDEWGSGKLYLIAIATTNSATSGAPTIKTDTLPTGTTGRDYNFTLTATTDISRWSASPVSGSSSGLPEGFTLDEKTGVLSADNDKITAEVGKYEFIVTAENDVSYHKKLLTLEISDNELASFGADSLWWDDKDSRLCVAWTPLKAPDKVTYTIQVYDADGNEVGKPFSKDLTSSFDSEFARQDVSSVITKKGTYSFTITATCNGYASSFADSTQFKDGTYAYGYAVYTLTAATSGTGTGTIELSRKSYNIPGIKAETISNGIKVKVREETVSEDMPLTFVFTPDKGCEVTALKVNNVPVTKNLEQYSITDLESIPVANVDENTSDSSSGDSSGDSSSIISGSTEGDSGVITMNESPTLMASQTVGKSLNISVEFGLISNSIGGKIVEETTYVQGEKASFEAFGQNMDATGATPDDTRWKPDYWYIDESETTHHWEKDTYTDSIDTKNLSLGEHTLYVVFQKQKYTAKSGWVDVSSKNSTDTRSVTFTVTDKFGSTDDPDKDADKDSEKDSDKDGDKDKDKEDSKSDDKKDTDGSDKKGADADDKSKDGSSDENSSAIDKVTSVLSGVDTGDDMVVALWAALAIASLAGIGFCIVQIFKYS